VGLSPLLVMLLIGLVMLLSMLQALVKSMWVILSVSDSFFCMGSVNEMWMDVGEVSNCFGCSNAFQEHLHQGTLFAVEEPCQEFVRFHHMLEFVKCTIAIDLASKMDLIVLCFSMVFPVAAKELFE